MSESQATRYILSGQRSRYIRGLRRSQQLKPYTKEQQAMTKDQRGFLASLFMQGASRGFVPVYGYGAGRRISKREIQPLVRRGLLKVQKGSWKKQQFSKAKQVHVRLTAKGKKYALAFHF